MKVKLLKVPTQRAAALGGHEPVRAQQRKHPAFAKTLSHGDSERVIEVNSAGETEHAGQAT
jgi:hypothetical protein